MQTCFFIVVDSEIFIPEVVGKMTDSSVLRYKSLCQTETLVSEGNGSDMKYGSGYLVCFQVMEKE